MLGALPPDPGGGFAASMKLGGSAPDTGGFAASAKPQTPVGAPPKVSLKGRGGCKCAWKGHKNGGLGAQPQRGLERSPTVGLGAKPPAGFGAEPQ